MVWKLEVCDLIIRTRKLGIELDEAEIFVRSRR